jgi:alpha-beta hydrolase superfamily lysophospholipase
LARKSFWTLVVVLAMLALVWVQAEAQQRSPRRLRGQVRDQGGVPLKKARPEAADPLAKAGGGAGGLVPGTYHFNFRLHSFDGTPLAASYYRSKLESAAPVVLLIHEAGRSRRDFEDPVLELKGQGLAEHLQQLNYAVLSLDVRGQGQNTRRALARDERVRMVEDLQAAYFFLVDRHNRGDLNLAKLGVVALGEGANLAAAWAFQPGAAITTEGRPSDLSALALVSPMPEGSGYLLGHVLASLAPRIPILLQAGERDNASKDAVQGVRKLVERARLNKVELYPSSLHGYKLLRLEPKVTTTLLHFLDTSLRGRAADWEPQYNLMPVTFSEIQTVPNARTADTEKKQAKPQDRAQDAAAPKAEEAKDRPAEKEKTRPRRPQPQPAPRDRPRNPG